MDKEKIEKGQEAPKRRDLITLALELGIADRYRMTKRRLVETIVLTRIYKALPRSLEIVHRLKKKELQWLCQRAGIRTNARSKKAELIKKIQRFIVKKRSSEMAGSDLPRLGDETIQHVSEAANLPDSYGETRVILLPLDPYLIHVHWEITPEDIERAKDRLGKIHAQSKPILRFYDITYILFDGTNAHGFFDVEIDLRTRNWYVHLWSPEKSYCADIGFKTTEGLFFSIIRSNVAQTAAAWPSVRAEERYMDGRTGRELIRTDDGYIEAEIGSRKSGKRASITMQAGQPEKQPVRPITAHSTDDSETLRLPNGQAPFPKAREPLSSATLFGSSRRTNDFDLTELSEQKFTAGLSSRSNEKG